MSLYDFSSGYCMISHRITRAKLKIARRLQESVLWVGMPLSCWVRITWLTGSLLPKHLPKKCNASRCLSASRCTACSSYCCFYQVEHCISGCRVISSQTYSYHSWHVGIGGFKKHKPRALVSGKQWVKSWPSTDTKFFASNSSF